MRAWAEALLARARRGLGAGGARALDLLLPPACLGCGELVARQGGLCSTCWRSMRWIAPPYCAVLGQPLPIDLGDSLVSPAAMAAPPPFARARAAVLYDDTARRIVHRLKYKDDTSLAPWLARWMVRAGRELVADADVVVPVPLHRARLIQRRFNQSAELARAIARQTELDYEPRLLRRTRNTKRQVGLGNAERRRNVQGAFAVPDTAVGNLAGRRVLLVDDVLTTGATASAATRTLRRAGATSVDVLTFARVDHRDDGMAFVSAVSAWGDAA